jgi:hypothetical protein
MKTFTISFAVQHAQRTSVNTWATDAKSQVCRDRQDSEAEHTVDKDLDKRRNASMRFHMRVQMACLRLYRFAANLLTGNSCFQQATY